jgi:hypothetical protein
MKRAVLAFLILIVVTFCLACPRTSLAGAKYSGGSGDANDPYQIGTVDDWETLMGDFTDYDKHFLLIADLDLEGIDVEPIGRDIDPAPNFQGTGFTGVFDGNDHVIRNAGIVRHEGQSQDIVGLFGLAFTYGEHCEIKNLTLENITVVGGNCVGGLLGLNEEGSNTASITRCTVSGYVSGQERVGGLVGYTPGCGCFAIIDCSSSAEVTGNFMVGGLVGDNGNPIYNSFATGRVNGINHAQYVGGLVGFNNSQIVRSYATGLVLGGYYLIGGLAGTNNSYIQECFATGAVVADDTNAAWPSWSVSIGGLVGSNSNSISNSYATGVVIGGCWVGGLVGDNGGPVSFSYSTGHVGVYTPNSNLGGLIALNSGIVNHCFWDVQTSGISVSAGGTPESTNEMKTITTFTSDLWDMQTMQDNGLRVWRLCTSGEDYPRLCGRNPAGRILSAPVACS